MTTKPASNVAQPPFGRSLDAVTLLAGEEWKRIPDYPFYWVSNYGRVFGETRLTAGGYIRKAKLLSQSYHHHGYRTVHLRRGKTTKRITVHRLVLMAFVGPCPEGMECCHNNSVRDDNRLENLRWDTHLNNLRERTIGKLTESAVVAIRQRLERGEGCASIARDYGVGRSAIHKIKSRMNWKYITTPTTPA